MATAHAARILCSAVSRLAPRRCRRLNVTRGVVAALIASEPGVRPVALPDAERVPGAMERRLGMQLLRGAAAGTDGFYYACVEKTTTGS